MKKNVDMGIDLQRPPFVRDPAQTAESVGIDMVNAFARLSAMAEPASGVFGALMDCAGLPAADSLREAGLRLAHHIDAGGGGGHRNPYHNTRHLCEVMLGAHFIAQLQELPARRTAEVVLAALMHDYGHDGTRNGAVAFRLERRSVTLALAVFGEGLLEPQLARRLSALVLATEYSRGQAFALKCHAAHERRARTGVDLGPFDAIPEPPREATELSLLASDAMAARQALVLCEADVLPSVGLTFGHALRMQAELSAEWDTALDVHDKLRFIDEWSRRTVLSLFFRPNVEVLRRLLLAGGS